MIPGSNVSLPTHRLLPTAASFSSPSASPLALLLTLRPGNVSLRFFAPQNRPPVGRMYRYAPSSAKLRRWCVYVSRGPWRTLTLMHEMNQGGCSQKNSEIHKGKHGGMNEEKKTERDCRCRR